MRLSTSAYDTGRFALGTLFVLTLGCRARSQSNDPTQGNNLLGPEVRLERADEMRPEEAPAVGSDFDDEPLAEVEHKKLPPRVKPVRRCKGRGKARQCEMVDPKPKVSAAHGVAALRGDFFWRQSPSQAFKRLTADIEAEYAKRQSEAGKDPGLQDRNRSWRQSEINAIVANHVKFTKASKHRWGVSLIQSEYQDDENEEMFWINTGTGLRKFYFFRDGELWKIFYAYNKDVWPGMGYAAVVEHKFKKWFGLSPKTIVERDVNTNQPQLSYYEWEALEGDKVRSFDFTSLHGIVALAIVDGELDARLGERLRRREPEERTSDLVEDVLGGSDVCYNEDGTIRACSEDEARDGI